MPSETRPLTGTSSLAYFSAGCSACKAASLRLWLELLLCTFIFLSSGSLGTSALPPVHSERKMKLIEASHEEGKRVWLHPGTYRYLHTHSWTCTSTRVYTHLHTHTHTHTDLLIFLKYFWKGCLSRHTGNSLPCPHVHLKDCRSPQKRKLQGKKWPGHCLCRPIHTGCPQPTSHTCPVSPTVPGSSELHFFHQSSYCILNPSLQIQLSVITYFAWVQ